MTGGGRQNLGAFRLRDRCGSPATTTAKLPTGYPPRLGAENRAASRGSAASACSYLPRTVDKLGGHSNRLPSLPVM